MQNLFQLPMQAFFWLLLVFLPFMAATPLQAASQDGYDMALPLSQSPSSSTLAPLPPQLPEYLPNGAVNLDQAWIQDGGARLYWNTLIIPRQLKMGGARWVDPALRPDLFATEKPKTRTRKTYGARPAQAQSAAKSQAKGNQGQSALKAPESPAIPLPLTPSTPQSPVITPMQAPATQATPSQPAVPLPSMPLPAATSPINQAN